MTAGQFDRSYYAANHQDADRPALWFYARLSRRYFPPGRVLDFGCGTGFFMKRLSRDFQVDGFDVSDHAADETRVRVPQARVFSLLDEIPRASYDGITALHVLEHISDSDLALVCRIWRQALLPGGRVICVMPVREGRGHLLKQQEWAGFKDATHINLKTSQEWRALLEGYGFAVLQVGTDGLWDFPYWLKRFRLLDMLLYAPATALQFLSGRLLLPDGSGESLILVLESRRYNQGD